jgi:hypothetical protein
METSPLCAFNLSDRGSSGTAVKLVCKRAVHVNLALHRLNWKLFLYPTTPASYDGTLLIAKYFDSHGLLATLRTREKLRQSLLGNVNDLSPSSPHLSIASILWNPRHSSILCLPLKMLVQREQILVLHNEQSMTAFLGPPVVSRSFPHFFKLASQLVLKYSPQPYNTEAAFLWS